MSIMKTKRSRVLRNKRLSLQQSLQEWAVKNKLLHVDEKLEFTLAIVKKVPRKRKPVVIYEKADCKLPLPPDDVPCGKYMKSCQIWHLTKEDWNKLGRLSWNEHQLAVLTALRNHDNGPLHISELDALGIGWDVKKDGFIRSFNKVLELISDYTHYVIGSRYFNLKQMDGQYRHYYAIHKQQYCAPQL